MGLIQWPRVKMIDSVRMLWYLSPVTDNAILQMYQLIAFTDELLQWYHDVVIVSHTMLFHFNANVLVHLTRALFTCILAC